MRAARSVSACETLKPSAFASSLSHSSASGSSSTSNRWGIWTPLSTLLFVGFACRAVKGTQLAYQRRRAHPVLTRLDHRRRHRRPTLSQLPERAAENPRRETPRRFPREQRATPHPPNGSASFTTPDVQSVAARRRVSYV